MRGGCRAYHATEAAAARGGPCQRVHAQHVQRHGPTCVHPP
jgi:hypothetical protein